MPKKATKTLNVDEETFDSVKLLAWYSRKTVKDYLKEVIGEKKRQLLHERMVAIKTSIEGEFDPCPK